MARYTLRAWFVGADYVTFTDPRPDVFAVAMTTAEHEAMGSPEAITVTVEPEA